MVPQQTRPRQERLDAVEPPAVTATLKRPLDRREWHRVMSPLAGDRRRPIRGFGECEAVRVVGDTHLATEGVGQVAASTLVPPRSRPIRTAPPLTTTVGAIGRGDGPSTGTDHRLWAVRRPVSRILYRSTCPGYCGDGHPSRTAVTRRLQQPTRKRGRTPPVLPYLVLLQVGFTSAALLPGRRCALTAPFHPYRYYESTGGIVSVALSVGSRRPAVNRHPVRWSSDFPPAYAAARRRPSGLLTLR